MLTCKVSGHFAKKEISNAIQGGGGGGHLKFWSLQWSLERIFKREKKLVEHNNHYPERASATPRRTY